MGDEIYTVYVLYSEKFDKTYIGFTNQLILRFYQHNEYSNKGYTKRFRPWKVLYCEWFQTKSEAMKREKWLKSGVGRSFIKNNIAAWSSGIRN